MSLKCSFVPQLLSKLREQARAGLNMCAVTSDEEMLEVPSHARRETV